MRAEQATQAGWFGHLAGASASEKSAGTLMTISDDSATTTGLHHTHAADGARYLQYSVPVVLRLCSAVLCFGRCCYALLMLVLYAMHHIDIRDAHMRLRG